jgi:hypothetical protein
MRGDVVFSRRFVQDAGMTCYSKPDPPRSDRCETILIAFRNRNPETDERIGLVRAIQRKGIPTFCILLRRHPLIAGLDVTPNKADLFKPISLVGIVRFIRKQAKNKKIIYLDTTGLTFAGTTLILKTLLPRGKWVLDINDDLLYAHTGLQRSAMRLRQSIIVKTSSIVTHAASTLRELFPNSHYLGNASEIEFIPRPAPNHRKIAILSSLDGRFDFKLVTEVASLLPGHEFHLYGRVNLGAIEAPAVAAKLEALIKSTPNLTYHGQYHNHDLRDILAEYTILFAPYLSKSDLVRYIDPIRFYAGLNSGMEIVTTLIPATAGFTDLLHIVANAPETVETLIRLERQPQSARRNKNPDVRRFTWDEKASRLLDILDTGRELDHK